MILNNYIDRIKEYYIKNKSIFIFLLFFPHIYHMVFPNGSISIIEWLFVRFRLLSFIILLILFIYSKNKPSKLLTLLCVADIWILITTIINNPNITNKAILYVCSSLSISIIIELNIKDINSLLLGFLPAFELHIYPNFVTVLLYRKVPSANCLSGYNDNNFFLGTKNDFILYLLPALFICIIYYLYNKKIVRPMALSIIILLTIILSNSITTLFSFLFLSVVFSFIHYVKKDNIRSIYPYVVFPILIFVVIVFPYMIVGQNAIVDFIMNNIYYRHSFISRTAIWTEASKYIKFKPFMGYGYINTSLAFVDDIGRVYYGNAHCDLIQRILNYGFIGFVLFTVFNIILLRKLNNTNSNKYKTISIAFICSIYLTFISQAYHRFFEFYTIFFMIYNIETIEDNIYKKTK